MGYLISFLLLTIAILIIMFLYRGGTIAELERDKQNAKRDLEIYKQEQAEFNIEQNKKILKLMSQKVEDFSPLICEFYYETFRYGEVYKYPYIADLLNIYLIFEQESKIDPSLPKYPFDFKDSIHKLVAMEQIARKALRYISPRIENLPTLRKEIYVLRKQLEYDKAEFETQKRILDTDIATYKKRNEQLSSMINNINLFFSEYTPSEILNWYKEKFKNPANDFIYVSSLMSDFLLCNIQKAEDFLRTSPKYHERQRAAKIAEIRQETKEIIEKQKSAQYQLEYLLNLYPELQEVIDSNFEDIITYSTIEQNREHYNEDPTSSFLSREEWQSLSETQRNQLALDRYLKKDKTNWEIGRDYELYVAYWYESKGYTVDTFGSYMRLNDLGRDLIVKKGKSVKVIQCKYWSAQKEIHENHICQLFGTVICYCIENNLKPEDVTGVFVTSTVLSKKAKEFAEMLNITIVEKFPLKDFPRIKCNINRDSEGNVTKIYHLPMDQMYDSVKIEKNDEFYAFTVKEAEEKGFRRAYRWHGNNDNELIIQ